MQYWWAKTKQSNDEDVDDPAPGPALSTAAAEAAGPAAAVPVDCYDVCLVAPRDCIFLVPCRLYRYARFCEIFAKRVAELPTGCPVDFLYDYVCTPFDTIDRRWLLWWHVWACSVRLLILCMSNIWTYHNIDWLTYFCAFFTLDWIQIN